MTYKEPSCLLWSDQDSIIIFIIFHLRIFIDFIWCANHLGLPWWCRRWRICLLCRKRPWRRKWDFFGGNDAKAETPVLWPPHANSWLIRKDSDAGRDWGQEEKGTTEDEMAGWHHWLDGHESDWTPGVGDGQEGLACWDSWGRKESDTTEQLIWSDLFYNLIMMLRNDVLMTKYLVSFLVLEAGEGRRKV